MRKKIVVIGMLCLIALVGAGVVGHNKCKTTYMNQGRAEGYLQGYVDATYETSTRIALHQQFGVLFSPVRIPSIILDALKRSATLKDFQANMSLLDSLNFGLLEVPAANPPQKDPTEKSI
jgi:hypothetical protein